MASGIVNEPWLATGDNLSRNDFLRIWEQLPDVKSAELIGGIVYMSSPVRREHGKIDKCITGWLAHYEAYTPGCESGINTTSLIGEDCPQPDDYLLILPECGGHSWGTKYVEGSPEFLAEISFTTASMDLHQKYDLYEREGVQEYLVVLIKRGQIRWHRLVDGRYQLIDSDALGVYRSFVFPGLWLDSTALFANDMAKVLATLQDGIASDEHQQFVAELARRRGEAK